ncbi:immediate early response 2b [Polymixia lowei]
MSATSAMDVNTEAKRILAVSISKLYASRSQRGGLRLHRSLLLSLVMRSARDIYHSACAQAAAEENMDTADAGAGAGDRTQAVPKSSTETRPEDREITGEVCDGEMAEDKENMSPARHSRKRRGKASVAPDFLPSKRARLEPGEERHTVPLGVGAPGLGNCRAGESLTAFSHSRVISAF